jgi:hypothetical protein
MMGLIAPPPSAGMVARVRGIALLIVIVIVLLAVGFGIAKLAALPFGGVGTAGAVLIGLLIVVAALAALAFFGRRRQERAKAARAAGS